MFKIISVAIVATMITQGAVAQQRNNRGSDSTRSQTQNQGPYDGEMVDVDEENSGDIISNDIDLAQNQEQSSDGSGSDEYTWIKKKKTVTKVKKESAPRANETPNKIYILNNSNATNENQPKMVTTTETTSTQSTDQTSRQAQDQDQLQDTRVDVDMRTKSLRQKRVNIENETEVKVVEKIEESRIKDEEKRAERLFGDRYDAIYTDNSNSKQKEVVVVEQKAPVSQNVEVTVKTNEPVVLPVVEPADEPEALPVPPKKSKKTSYHHSEEEDEVHQDVSSDYNFRGTRWMDGKRSYFGVDVGMGQYQDASNVKGNAAGGIGIGVELPSGLAVEARFKYSTFELEEMQGPQNNNYMPPVVRDVTQNNYSVGAKYRFLKSDFSPTVGALLGYTYRSYASKGSSDYAATTSAWDAGVSVGADLRVNDGFSLGADVLFMNNLNYSINSSTAKFNPYGTNLEAFKYYFASVSAKFYF